ncbi:MAG: redox-sensing transcriptional repressor Rex [Pirellulales bacterium]
MSRSEPSDQSEVSSEAHTASISGPTANRLGLYLRELQHLQRSGVATIRSGFLATRLGLSDSQIRRDLAQLGQLGKRGVGYEVTELIKRMRHILGTDGQWRTVIIGLGNLGQALMHYRGFREQGFQVVAVYESDPTKAGRTFEGVPVLAVDDLEKTLPKLGIDLAILAVPSPAAAAVADRLTRAGVKGILNFAPVSLNQQPSTAVVDVDLAIELQRLAFAVVNRQRSG